MTDKAGPCEVCGRSINDPIHAPPNAGKTLTGADGVNWHGHAWRSSVPLSDETKRDVCAADLVVALRMWDYTRGEADDILRRARKLVKAANDWSNPLAGTGLKAVAGTGGTRQ